MTSSDFCGRLLIFDGCGRADTLVGCGPHMQNNINNKLKLQWIKNYDNKLKKKLENFDFGFGIFYLVNISILPWLKPQNHVQAI